VEIGHNEKANNTANNSEEFDFIIRRDTIREVLSDLTVENNSETASD